MLMARFIERRLGQVTKQLHALTREKNILDSELRSARTGVSDTIIIARLRDAGLNVGE